MTCRDYTYSRLDAKAVFERAQKGGNGCGLAESALYDEEGVIGQATQTLAVRLK